MKEDTKQALEEVVGTLEAELEGMDMFHSYETNRAIGILEALLHEER